MAPRIFDARPVWRSGKGGLVAGNRYIARVRHLFAWSIDQGYRGDSPFGCLGVVAIRLQKSVEGGRTREAAEEGRLIAPPRHTSDDHCRQATRPRPTTRSYPLTS